MLSHDRRDAFLCVYARACGASLSIGMTSEFRWYTPDLAIDFAMDLAPDARQAIVDRKTIEFCGTLPKFNPRMRYRTASFVCDAVEVFRYLK
jgi:hypothetical protein